MTTGNDLVLGQAETARAKLYRSLDAISGPAGVLQRDGRVFNLPIDDRLLPAALALAKMREIRPELIWFVVVIFSFFSPVNSGYPLYRKRRANFSISLSR